MKPVVQAISKNEDFDQSLPLTPRLSAAQKKTLTSKNCQTRPFDFGFDGSDAFFPLNSLKITFDKMMVSRQHGKCGFPIPSKQWTFGYTLDGSETR